MHRDRDDRHRSKDPTPDGVQWQALCRRQSHRRAFLTAYVRSRLWIHLRTCRLRDDGTRAAIRLSEQRKREKREKRAPKMLRFYRPKRTRGQGGCNRRSHSTTSTCLTMESIAAIDTYWIECKHCKTICAVCLVRTSRQKKTLQRTCKSIVWFKTSS